MFIFSIGPCCITKNLINELGYISKTGPFDWMFSSIDSIHKIIMDDFSNLLDKTFLRSENPCWDVNKSFNIKYNNAIKNNTNVSSHLIRKNEMMDYNNFHMFNHYNLLDEQQYDKYYKIVDRFKNNLKSPNHKLFLYINYYNDSSESLFELNKYFEKTIDNYTILSINCIKVDSICNSDLNCVYEHENLVIYNFYITDYNDFFDNGQIGKLGGVISYYFNLHL
jgi:hypothetical protein